MIKNKETGAIVIITLVSLVMGIGMIASNRDMKEVQVTNQILREDIEMLETNISKLNSEVGILYDQNLLLDSDLKTSRQDNVELLEQIKTLQVQKDSLVKENALLKVKPKVSRSSTRSKDTTINSKPPHTSTTKSKPSKGINTQVATKQGDKQLLGTFEATAYTDDAQSQGKWVGQTASGMKPQVGVIAVDTKVIPLGTKLYVEGYGNAIAGDTGGAIKGNRVDLFFNTKSECTNYGRRSVKVWRR